MTDSISVIIPTYGRDETLLRAVQSVLEQTHPPAEIIVVDDHSPIPATTFLESSDLNLNRIETVRHEENKGGNAARTTGIKNSTGDYLAFLDDDDEWHPEKLEQQIKLAEATDNGVIYTGVQQVTGGEVVAEKTPSIEGTVMEELFSGNPIGTFSSVMVRSDVVDDAGYPDSTFPAWQDWEYYLRLSEVATFASVSTPLTVRHSGRHKQNSDDYEKRRDISAPRLLDRYGELADRRGCYSRFLAGVEFELGRSAMVTRNYQAARSHLVSSFRARPTSTTLLYLGLVSGGRFTFRPAQKVKQTVVSLLAQS